jgi:hypothetical protein
MHAADCTPVKKPAVRSHRRRVPSKCPGKQVHAARDTYWPDWNRATATRLEVVPDLVEVEVAVPRLTVGLDVRRYQHCA